MKINMELLFDMTSEQVFEFLDLYEKELVLWDPRHPLNKNRVAVKESWKRIHKSFSVKCTLDELKKKKESLMASFRPLVKKVKANQNAEGAKIFKPSWFAYERMAKFLFPIYETRTRHTIKGVREDRTDVENMEENDIPHEESSPEPNVTSDGNQGMSWQVPRSSLTNLGKRKPSRVEIIESQVVDDRKKQRTVEIIECHLGDSRSEEIQTEDAPQVSKVNTEICDKNASDSCDLFVELLGKKLKAFDEVTRVILMHAIDNLVFGAKMNQLKIKLPTSTFSQLLSNVTEFPPMQPQTLPSA